MEQVKKRGETFSEIELSRRDTTVTHRAGKEEGLWSAECGRQHADLRYLLTYEERKADQKAGAVDPDLHDLKPRFKREGQREKTSERAPGLFSPPKN